MTPNAERQRAFRERHVVVLTRDAREIAAKLVGMDQAKLEKIARLISAHLARRKKRTGKSND